MSKIELMFSKDLKVKINWLIIKLIKSILKWIQVQLYPKEQIMLII